MVEGPALAAISIDRKRWTKNRPSGVSTGSVQGFLERLDEAGWPPSVEARGQPYTTTSNGRFANGSNEETTS
jgi:hypothetical protein